MESMMRTRWAAIGAAVAVAAGGIGVARATVSEGDRDVFVAIEPCRLLDTRPDFQVGNRTTPIGPGEIYEVESHGPNGDCNLDSGASGLVLNVTALNATAPTNVRIFPADASEVPTVSNLNALPGQPPAPNAVTTKLSSDGEFAIFNAFGGVDIIVDVAGYYEDHDHDDRYLTDAEVGALVDGHDHDGTYLPGGNITVRYAPASWVAEDIVDPPAAFNHLANQTKVDGSGMVIMPLTGPMGFGNGADRIDYRLINVTYCIDSADSSTVTEASVVAAGPGSSDVVTDGTVRVSPGCYEIDVSGGSLVGTSFQLNVVTAGVGVIILSTVMATWEPFLV